MEITGTIVEIFPTAQITESFKKREFVVEYSENPKYPELIKFECVQDKCSLLDSLSVGANVEVAFNLRGRAYTNKEGQKSYFTTLQAWKIQSQGAAQSAPEMAPSPAFKAEDIPSENDDLPF